MWAETKHGLYKQFVFSNFKHAWAFMEKVSAAVNDLDHHPRSHERSMRWQMERKKLLWRMMMKKILH
jgi:pterin-4a-carbinolamine dehydratase